MMFKLLQNVTAGSSRQVWWIQKVAGESVNRNHSHGLTQTFGSIIHSIIFLIFLGVLLVRQASSNYSCFFSLQQASSLDEPLKCTSATALSHGVRSLLPLARILPDTPSHCYSAPSTLTARRPTPYPCTFRPHMPFRQASSEASEKIGNIQRRLAWPLRKDDMITREGD